MFWFDNKELCKVWIFNAGEYEFVFFWDVMCTNYVSPYLIRITSQNTKIVSSA